MKRLIAQINFAYRKNVKFSFAPKKAISDAFAPEEIKCSES